MGQRLECPGCGTETSTVLSEVSHGRPCPSCGLSAGAIHEIDTVRRSNADRQLKARTEEAVKERDAWKRRAVIAERRIEIIREALGSNAVADIDWRAHE